MTTATIDFVGTTFAVDDVTPAAEPLKEQRTHEAVRAALDGRLESCCDYHGTVVANVRGHPLLAAVHTAFAEHRPLVLTPDAVWVTIAQGVAHHMAIHGERLRDRFVAHAGKLDLIVEVDGWVRGSPENPWPDAFAGWAGQIRGHVGSTVHDALVCDFTTTTPADRAASHVVMMDVFRRYFHYVMLCVCGIPTVTLTGTPADWQRLAAKAEALRVFDMDWWLDHLVPICRQFARAAAGDVDRPHWQAICKRQEEYGGDIINGWVAKLFPYLREFTRGPCTRRNPIFDTGEGFQSSASPSGLSKAPITWRDTTGDRPMEAVGGLLGVAQDRATLALRPTVGWAVREADRLDALLGRLTTEHRTSPGVKLSRRDHFDEEGMSANAEIGRLYHAAGSADLFGTGPAAVYRILPPAEVKAIDVCSGKGPWHDLVALQDGGRLAVYADRLSPKYIPAICDRPDLRKRFANEAEAERLVPVWYQPPRRWQRGRIVALSLPELLQRMLDSDGNLRWLWTDSGYLGAEHYMDPR